MLIMLIIQAMVQALAVFVLFSYIGCGDLSLLSFAAVSAVIFGSGIAIGTLVSIMGEDTTPSA